MTAPTTLTAVVAAGLLAAAAIVVAAARVAAPIRLVARPAAAAPVARGRRKQLRRGSEDLALAEWCEHAARSLRGGASLSRAIADASASAPAAAAHFAPVRHALERGRALSAAVAGLDTDPSRPIGLVAAVLHACAELGGPAAGPLERTAATLHARAAERAERVTASAQARLSARVLTLLPVGTLILLVAAEDATRAAVGTPAGLACLVAGGASNLAGWWWMRRIIARVR